MEALLYKIKAFRHFGVSVHPILQRRGIAQNIAETCQKYFQSFIATEILSQYFLKIFQNILSQHCNFNFLNFFDNK